MLISECSACRPASQRNGIRQTQVPLAAQCGAQETKPTQRVGMNNCYYNEGRTWQVSGVNPSARTRAEPHNFLSLKLLNKNSNAELLEIQKDRHLEIVVPVLTSAVEVPSLPGILAALGIAPGWGDALGSLRAPARAAPADAVESFADQPR